METRLEWPDTFSWAPEGNTLYFKTLAIRRTSGWNKGVGQPREPFCIYKMAVSK